MYSAAGAGTEAHGCAFIVRSFLIQVFSLRRSTAAFFVLPALQLEAGTSQSVFLLPFGYFHSITVGRTLLLSAGLADLILGAVVLLLNLLLVSTIFRMRRGDG